VDTGAYSAALGVADCELIQIGDDLRVRFRVPISRRHPDRLEVVEEPVVKLVTVCNSSGCRESRPLIEPVIRVGPFSRRVRLTLTDRSRMRCPMLLGRQLLAETFLVDVRVKYLLGSGRPG
jgi:hypothetical protein